MFMNVHLPEPEGPITATNSPGRIESVMPSSARTSTSPIWYTRTRSSIRMTSATSGLRRASGPRRPAVLPAVASAFAVASPTTIVSPALSSPEATCVKRPSEMPVRIETGLGSPNPSAAIV